MNHPKSLPFEFLPVRRSLINEDGLVTLSVISHGHNDVITGLLEDLARCKPPRVAQLVVTLNLSEPRPEVPRGLDIPIHWCNNPYPKGFGANHNAAFRFCDTEFFAVVNPDIRFDTDPFSPLLDHAGDEFGLVGPRVFESDGRIADAARGLITPWEIIARRLRPRPRCDIPPGWQVCSYFFAQRLIRVLAVLTSAFICIAKTSIFAPGYVCSAGLSAYLTPQE